MPTTQDSARDILLDAFEDIVVRMDEETLGASDERTGIKAINRIMSSLALNGVNVGFTQLTKISDLITIPDGLMDALVSLLAYRLWPKYRSGEPSSTIVLNARNGSRKMYKYGVTIGASEYPGTLPRGSGNTAPGLNDDTFFSDLTSTILSETNGSISLEDSTNV